MSEKLEVKQPATLESLKQVKYQDLKETFTILGVPEAWKPGSKASKMIADALEKLAIIRDLKTKGLEGEQLEAAKQKQLEINESNVNDAIEEEAEQAIQKIESEKKSYKEEVESMNLSKDQIENALVNINLNLKQGLPTHRAILLKKKAVLEEILNEVGD